jgi:hypothetical protein
VDLGREGGLQGEQQHWRDEDAPWMAMCNTGGVTGRKMAQGVGLIPIQ